MLTTITGWVGTDGTDNDPIVDTGVDDAMVVHTGVITFPTMEFGCVPAADVLVIGCPAIEFNV